MTGRKNKVKELPELNSAWLGPPALVWPRPPAWSPHSLGVGMGPGLMRPRPPARSLPTLCLPDGTLPAILHAISVKRWLWTYRSKLPSLCHKSNVADCRPVSHRKGVNDSPEAHSSPPVCTRRLLHRAITPPLPSHSFRHQLHCLSLNIAVPWTWSSHTTGGSASPLHPTRAPLSDCPLALKNAPTLHLLPGNMSAFSCSDQKLLSQPCRILFHGLASGKSYSLCVQTAHVLQPSPVSHTHPCPRLPQ